MPALWMTASKVPIASASSASPLHLGRAGQVGDEDVGEARQLAAEPSAFSVLRAWPTTRWPSSTRRRAASRPRPSLEPVTRTIDDHAPVVSTTRKRAAPLIIRAYPSAACSSG